MKVQLPNVHICVYCKIMTEKNMFLIPNWNQFCLLIVFDCMCNRKREKSQVNFGLYLQPREQYLRDNLYAATTEGLERGHTDDFLKEW